MNHHPASRTHRRDASATLPRRRYSKAPHIAETNFGSASLVIA
eukprot:CAMPEP_0174888048 /NCGR_PEP_ID=MMETSP0167-20121228/3308_1 /TAXON_ID=38298 /ORGANISM="Rhodella maculata, Strain CCMP736" /LENGTH=42 /DNA_ID= /DNA_START= /DNA_END= /DNA_ORIENTATION=